ncbi:unnamed protein product [Prorocentrum cordatum]|uniref:GST C-terminal domain-containing protein n=1 Tax=Prorocentrum cordatum TaxID=2364126 RepID=A0ABN9T1J2_9DINO|nr:unnamed protein product [Polarella glacialis]
MFPSFLSLANSCGGPLRTMWYRYRGGLACLRRSPLPDTYTLDGQRHLSRARALTLVAGAAGAVTTAVKQKTECECESTLYANMGCPYAVRAMFALKLRPASGVRIENMPTTNQFGLMDKWGIAKGDVFGLFRGKSLDDLHRYKEWFKREVNASGEVPTLLLDTGDVVRESEIVAEYFDATSPCTARKLVPIDPLDASKVRLAMKMANALPGPMVALLKNQDPAKDEEIAKTLSAALSKFAAVLEDKSDFCVGASCTLADVHSAVFLHRFGVVLKHYRGYDMFQQHPRLRRLLDAVMAMPEYLALLEEYGVTDARFIAMYELYANNGTWSQDGTRLAGRGRSEFGR